MPIRSWKPKGSTVKAFKWNLDELNAISAWCNGLAIKHDILENSVVKIPTLDGILELHQNQYLCRNEARGFFVIDAEAFEISYEPVKGSTRSKE